jgi:hypothetical protein
MMAFNQCSHGLLDITGEDLDDNAWIWVKTLRAAIETTGSEDPAERGTSVLKAERFTLDQKADFSFAVSELATWFHDLFMSR